MNMLRHLRYLIVYFQSVFSSTEKIKQADNKF